jgi:hypothetical protein
MSANFFFSLGLIGLIWGAMWCPMIGPHVTLLLVCIAESYAQSTFLLAYKFNVVRQLRGGGGESVVTELKQLCFF